MSSLPPYEKTKQKKRVDFSKGAAGKAVLTERNEFVFFIRFIILRNSAGFAVLVSQFIYFFVSQSSFNVIWNSFVSYCGHLDARRPAPAATRPQSY